MNHAQAITTLRVQIKYLAAAAAEVTFRDHVARAARRTNRRGADVPMDSPLEAFDQIANNLAAPALEALEALAVLAGVANATRTGQAGQASELRSRVDGRAANLKETKTMSNTNTKPKTMTQEEIDAEIQRLQADFQATDDARRKAKDAEEQERADKTKREQAERIEAELKASARLTWAGTPADFEKAWPKMREQLLIEKTADDLKKARADFGATIQGMF